MPYLKHHTPAKKQRNYNTKSREERAEVYNTTRWRATRENYLREHPLCEMCLIDEKVEPATQVHHRDSFMNYNGLKRVEVAFDYDNLMALCAECHAKLHGKEGRTNDKPNQ